MTDSTYLEYYKGQAYLVIEDVSPETLSSLLPTAEVTVTTFGHYDPETWSDTKENLLKYYSVVQKESIPS